jgi:YfiH family protein
LSQRYPFASLVPQWPAPANIVAFTSCRQGGFSAAPYDEFNLGLHVGDDPESVRLNRQQLLSNCQGLQGIQWLQQAHGNATVYADGGSTELQADAAYTDQAGIACAVMTADCLPVLLCDNQGQQVAAVHAGWRGLAAGVIESAVDCFEAAPGQLMAWLGPAISQQYFEVGEEVFEQFLSKASAADKPAVEAAFVAISQGGGHYLADLYGLAKIRLSALGITAIYGGDTCCYKDASRFFSYRREAVTGRMVSVIYKKP